MTRILVLGGTGWLGAEIAQRWIAAGAHVVCLARGESGPVPDGATLVPADRHDPAAYDTLDGEWDEVVELSYDPAFVEPALDALAHRARHWTLVSTVSVYATNRDGGADESAELVEPVDLSRYADAKVAAERVTERVTGGALLARSGLIVGPGDPTDRFGYWMARLARTGPILAPTLPGRHVQVIDVGDLAAWIVHAALEGVTGPVNAVGPTHTMADLFATARRVTEYHGEFIHASDDELRAQDVRPWAGPRSLPLWLPLEEDAFAQRSWTAFRATGGRTRPLERTLQRTLDDERRRGIDRARRAGLSRAEEADILAALASA